MAFELSQLTSAKTKGIEQKPQLVLEIEGFNKILGIGSIKKYVRIGDEGLEIGDDWVIGGFNPVTNQLDVISLDGTTTTIAQQLQIDKGGASSVSSIQMSLLPDQEIIDLISPGVVLNDLLGVKATLSLGYQETAYPQDFITVFSGIIDEIQASGKIILNIAHPEQKKRFETFQKGSTTLTAPAEFRSATIGSLKFITRQGVVGTVTMQFTAGGTAGSEVVSVVGNAITVQIQSGVSTASQIRGAIEKVPAATALIDTSIKQNESGNAQSASALTSLGSSTTLTVLDNSNFLLPADSGTLKTYVRINDEVIEYTSTNGTQFLGCTREALVDIDPRAFGNQHAIGDTVDSFYRLQGNAFDLALKIYLSGPDAYFAENVKIKNFITVDEFGDVANAVYFDGVDVIDKYGLTPGDFITTTGDVVSGNNQTLVTISDVIKSGFGSYVVVNGAGFVLSANSPATASFRSKYNVLPEGAGLGLGGDEVDVPEFERIKELFFTSIFDYDFYIKDTVQTKDFVDSLLFSTGAFTLPRKGKISLGFTAPPLGISDIKKLDETNTAKPQGNNIVRGISSYFYNNIVYVYNESVLDDGKFLHGTITSSADSKNRIKVGNKVLTIEAPGLRPTPSNTAVVNILTGRLLDRYRFAGERIKTEAFYGDGFNVDVGDTVLFGNSSLKLIDTRTASKDFKPRLFEVVNRSLDIKTGKVALSLVDTNYSTEGRYGIVSPSSKTDAGSTVDYLILKDSFSTVAPKIEKDKWTKYIGEEITVHNEDYSVSENTTILAFDEGNNYKMFIDPPLSFAAPADYIVDIPEYGAGDVDERAVYKQIFVFASPSPAVVSGTDDLNFDVGAGDIGKLFVGSTILVHNDDYSIISPEVKVSAISGNTVTVDASLGFTPGTGYIVELVGFFNDEGTSYRFL